MQVKTELINLLNTMTENQLIYVYTFLSKMFGVPIKNKG